MYQEKEFLGALLQLPNEQGIEIIKNKYDALVLFNIANRCINKGLIDSSKISFSLSPDRDIFVFVTNSQGFELITEKGRELLLD